MLCEGTQTLHIYNVDVYDYVDSSDFMRHIVLCSVSHDRYHGNNIHKFSTASTVPAYCETTYARKEYCLLHSKANGYLSSNADPQRDRWWLQTFQQCNSSEGGDSHKLHYPNQCTIYCQ